MTYEEYENAVIAELIKRAGWSEKEARNMVGDLHEFIDLKLSPSEAVSELLFEAGR